MAGASLLILVGLGPWAVSAQQQPQKIEPPKWLSDEGKDIFSDLMTAEFPYNEASCESREAYLKTLMGNAGQEAAHYRFQCLKDMGVCEFIKGNYDKSKKRLDSGVSELNLPSDDMMKTNQDLAPVGLLREASNFMTKHELTQAATAIRRSREISERNIKKIIKMVHKQMSQGGKDNVPPAQNIIDEISGYGRTGQILPMLMPQAPMLKQEVQFYEQIDKIAEELDKQLSGFAPHQKTIRKTLDTSKGSKGGTLMYVRGLVAEATAPGDRLMAAAQMSSEGVVKAFKEEGATADKSLTLLKRSKEGTGCKEGKGMTKTCEALAKIADLKSNIFGETRVLALKAGKKQPLESCSTNANIGILLAAGSGVTATVAGAPHDLVAGLPLVVDFCQEVVLESAAAGAVLFGQAWHPEYAAVERTGEIRTRSKTFDLSEDEVKAATKVVNDFAKKHWEQAGKNWRLESPLVDGIKSSLAGAKDAAKAQAEADAEAKKKEDEAGDTERAANLVKLEAKRAEKKKKAEDREKKSADRVKQLEAERQNRDPWLNDPSVLEVEKKLADLKEARRDANAKLEFDLTSQLTKDISAAERELKKATKAAKKEFKKGGGHVPSKKEEKAAEKAADNTAKIADVKARLEEVKKKKAEAAEKEDYGAAKTLKVDQKQLEDQLKKLEL